MKILEFLPGKTRKQISDKRMYLGLTNRSALTADDNNLELLLIPTDALPQSIGVGGFLIPVEHDEIIRCLARIKTSTAVGSSRTGWQRPT